MAGVDNSKPKQCLYHIISALLGVLMPQSDYYQVHRRLIRRSGARLQRPIAHAVEIGMPLVFQRFASCNEVLHHN